MSIFKSAWDVFDISCDICEFTPEDAALSSFQDGVAYARTHGWITRKNAEHEWENICPTCAARIRAAGN